MERKMLMDESKVFDACAMVEEIVEHLKNNEISVSYIMEKASKASLLLNQAMEEGGLA